MIAASSCSRCTRLEGGDVSIKERVLGPIVTPIIEVSLMLHGDPYSSNNSFRRRRFSRFIELVNVVLAEKGACHVLDMGGTEKYWQTFAEPDLDPRVRVTLVNLPGTQEPQRDKAFTYVTGDACGLPQLDDRSFDIVHSNSVIEHVGLWDRMASFAGEVRRLAPRYFIQTPNYWFPVEAHARWPYFHLLPEPWRARMLLRRKYGFLPRATSIGEATKIAQYSFLLDSRQMQELFPEAQIEKERVLGLTKALVAVRR